MQGVVEYVVPIKFYSRKEWLDIYNTFLFPLDRMLIISENRKCGEGLPEGQQKKYDLVKKRHNTGEKRNVSKKTAGLFCHMGRQKKELCKYNIWQNWPQTSGKSLLLERKWMKSNVLEKCEECWMHEGRPSASSDTTATSSGHEGCFPVKFPFFPCTFWKMNSIKDTPIEIFPLSSNNKVETGGWDELHQELAQFNHFRHVSEELEVKTLDYSQEPIWNDNKTEGKILEIRLLI